MFTDTHTHLYEETLITDPEQITRAINAGVTKMFMPNCDSNTIAPMMALAKQWPDHCFPMMGLHPTYVKDGFQAELDVVSNNLSAGKFYAVGEIGLDYYWDVTYKEQQIEAFSIQTDWALQYNLPIVIHSREATGDCIDMVRKKQNGKLKGIFHCFSGTIDEAREIINLGFYLGIGGVITYKKSDLPTVIKAIPLENIVLETDAPYLAPAPFRGKRNESSYIPLIAEKIAGIKEVSVAAVADITSLNSFKIFGI